MGRGRQETAEQQLGHARAVLSGRPSHLAGELAPRAGHRHGEEEIPRGFDGPPVCELALIRNALKDREPLGRLLGRLQPPSLAKVDRVAAMVREDLSGVPELRELLLASEQLPSFEPTFIAMLHAALRLRGPRPEVALTAEQLSSLTQPTQLIWGEEDPFGPPAAGERAVKTLPTAEFHRVSGGHAPWVNHARSIARFAVPFLRRHRVELPRSA